MLSHVTPAPDIAVSDVKLTLNADKRPSGHANVTFPTVVALKNALELTEEVLPAFRNQPTLYTPLLVHPVAPRAH